MPGIECKFSSLSAKIKLKQIKILTSCHRSASKNSKDLLAGLLFFFFSSNRRSAVLKLYKSWYETLFFADRAVIAAILNSLDILLFRSIINTIIAPRTCFCLLNYASKTSFRLFTTDLGCCEFFFYPNYAVFSSFSLLPVKYRIFPLYIFSKYVKFSYI